MNQQHTAENITLNLRWFSVLAEKRGCRHEFLTANPNISGKDLIDLLAVQTPEIDQYRNYIRLAVNQDYADLSTVLRDGDEVALITPVSGG